MTPSALRPTREGVVAALLVCAVAALAMLTGNNLLYGLVALGLALFAVDTVLAAWNLRGVEVARVLPSELYAGVEARGRWVVRNRRRFLPAVAVEVEELGGDAAASVGAVPAGGEAELPTDWLFPERGVAHLGAVRLTSSFPFGFAKRRRFAELDADVVVYPRPARSFGTARPALAGQDEGEARGGDQGDFVGLRAYRPGDPPRSIHWPTTARAGVYMVVQRAGGGVEQVVVRVPERRGEAWERELSRACGEVLRGFTTGAHVGLELPSRWLEPRTGEAWRRELLEVLAREPARSEGA